MNSLDRMEMLYDAEMMVLDACDVIKGAGKCDRCPMYCIEDDSWWDIADSKTKGQIAEFFRLADSIRDFVSDEDYIADLADIQRKEIDDWYD